MKLMGVEEMRLLGVYKTINRYRINHNWCIHVCYTNSFVKHNVLKILGFKFFTQLVYWSRPKNTL